MELSFKTFERQRLALRYLRDKTTSEVLYGGGARGGKSWLGNGWIILEALTKPESAWLIAREEMTKLRDTTLLTFFKCAKGLGLTDPEHYHFHGSNLTVTFYNGSRIFFREIKFIPSDPEFDRLGSYDLTGSFLDECQQIHAKAISVLRGRYSVLSGENWKTIPKSLYTCNPAKNWIYKDFIKPDIQKELPSYRKVVRSLATDNPFVDETYLENLRRSDKVTVERLLHGNFEYDDDPAVLMPYDKIMAIWYNYQIPAGDKYITSDVARYGRDKSKIAVWDGWRLIDYKTYEKLSIPDVAEKIKAKMTQYNIPPSRVVVDDDGVGGGVVDLVKCHGFVNGGKPLEERFPKVGLQTPNYRNLKSQCYYGLADKVNDGEMFIGEGVMTPQEKEETVQELEQVKQKDMDKDNKKEVIPKESVKELIGRSPDNSDVLMMRKFFDLKSPKKWVVG